MNSTKGDVSWAIVLWMIALVFLFVMIYQLTNQNSKLHAFMTGAQQCESMGLGQGECKTRGECKGLYLSSVECEKGGLGCCFEEKDADGEVHEYEDCTNAPNTWMDASKCRVRMEWGDVSDNVHQGEDFHVFCRTNVNNAPCVSMKITRVDEEEKAAYCQLQPSNRGTNIFDFKCAGGLGLARGEYDVYCLIVAEKCAVSGPDDLEYKLPERLVIN